MDSVHEMIEKRAYELYLARGSVGGYAEKDWIQAEKDVRAELERKKSKAAAPKPAEEKAPVKPAEKVAEKAPQKPVEKIAEKVPEKPVEKATEKPVEKAPEKQPERASQVKAMPSAKPERKEDFFKEEPKDKTVKAQATAALSPAKKRATKKNSD